MTQKAQALVLAEPDASLRTALESACQDAGYDLVTEPSAEVATSRLSAKRFDALVLDMTTPGAALVCMKARGKLVRIRIPVIALVEEEDEVAFARAYRAGADEVLLAGRPAAITSRLRSLPKSGIPQPGASRGDAVVADADRARAEVLERVLRDSGFRVELAVDGFAARLQVGRPSLKVAVLDASLDDAPALIAQARTRGARCAWIVRGRPDGLDELRTQLAKLDRVSVVNAYGPPDDVLFEANRLLEPRQSDGRADQRMLHGTIVNLRWDGRGETDIGYTYNVSSVGLFIRTLAAPSSSTVELELVPPAMDTKVRLQAEVIWRREFGTTRREPVPAGFGVKVTGGDVETWAQACPRARSMPPRSVIPVPELKSEPPPSAFPTARVATPDVAPAEAIADKAAPGPRRSPSTDKLRLPERLRVPAVQSAFAAAVKRKEPSPPPPRVTEKETVVPGKPLPGREPQSSVEEMLLSVLSGSSPGEDVLGAAPLSIDGDEVVELDKPGGSAEAAPSDQPPQPSVEPPPPSLEPPPPVIETKPTSVEPPPPSRDAPTIEVHGAPSAAPAMPEQRSGDSEAPSIEVHARRSAMPAPAPKSEPTSTMPAPPRIEPKHAKLAPPPRSEPKHARPAPPRSEPKHAMPAPAPIPSEPPEPIEPEFIDLPSDKPPPPAAVPEASTVPKSMEVESTDFVPDELQKLAAASKDVEEPASGHPKPFDPLAATIRAASSPFPIEALPDGLRPEPPPPASEPPQTTPSQVPPSATNIGPDSEIVIPKTHSSGIVWVSVLAVGAGIAAFFAVPFIRNLISPPAPVATESPAALVTVATASPTPSVAPAEATPANSAAASPEPPASASAAALAAPPEPSAVPPTAASATVAAPTPGSSEEPDPAALASLERGTGFLFVASSLQTNVYLYGVLAGTTNQRLVSKCGPRFIRLGTAPGTWQSDGVVSVVKCGGFTRVRIAP